MSQDNLRFSMRFNGRHAFQTCKVREAAWRAGYPKVLKDVAIETAKAFLAHSYPAPGNDPMKGDGNTPAAKQQGEYNLRKDINSMFYPLSKHSVKELVGMRNDVVFQLGNPIEWRDESLARAWASQDMDSLFMAFHSLGTATGEANDYINNELTYFNDVQLNTVNYVEVPNEEIHQSSMRNGRWDGKTRTAVRNRQVIEQFIRRKMRDIGKSANGWVDILKKLGSAASSVLPGKGLGTLTKTNGQNSVGYKMNNAWGNPNGMLDAAKDKVVNDSRALLKQKTKELVDRVTKMPGPPYNPPRNTP
jgi:hypothetical protein